MKKNTDDVIKKLFGEDVIEIDTSVTSKNDNGQEEQKNNSSGNKHTDSQSDTVRNAQRENDTKEEKRNQKDARTETRKSSHPKKNGSVEDSQEAIRKEKVSDKKSRWKKHGIRIGIALCILTGMYLTFVYSDIPFIAKWRTIYIETAMTTNSHQWLATLFFPQSVIDEVMETRRKSFEAQADVASSWENIEKETDTDRDTFYTKYWELDTVSFRKYLEEHPGQILDGYNDILIKDLDKELGLKTAAGDDVLVVDTANNLLIIGVKGNGYQGKLAIVKDPSQITFGKSSALGSFGQEIDSFCESYDAILGINASGFKDVDGVGTGGEVNGCLVIDGVDYGSHYKDAAWKFFGFKDDNRLYITNYSNGIEKEYRWGMEFFPALIVDGKNVVDGTYGMGIQPRSAFGQTKNGDVLMLVVDGRQTHSLGCTVDDCSKILLRYHTYQAMNLDGGSSSVMYYDGEFITSSSSVTGRGRYMPDAFLVTKGSEETVIDAKPATAKE